MIRAGRIYIRAPNSRPPAPSPRLPAPSQDESMRAVIYEGAGGPEVITIGEVPKPEVRPEHIRVRVHAAGLNRADLIQRRGQYAAPPGWPANIPGLEYAGEVDSAHRLESHRSRKGWSRQAWIAMVSYSAIVFFFGLTTGYVARDYSAPATPSALYAQGHPAPLRIDYDLRNR